MPNPLSEPNRKFGITKNNFYTLYDMAMLGITNHSKVPLRIATMAGFVMAGLSMFVAVGYLVAKLLFWDWFTVGVAPIIISLFFFSSVQSLYRHHWETHRRHSYAGAKAPSGD